MTPTQETPDPDDPTQLASDGDAVLDGVPAPTGDELKSILESE